MALTLVDRMQYRARNDHVREGNYTETGALLRDGAARINVLEAEMVTARSVVKIANELCTAVDLMAEDIGGHRPVDKILRELGPAVDVAVGAQANAEKSNA